MASCMHSKKEGISTSGTETKMITEDLQEV